jgi:plasmid stabilization system protein ParE
VKYRLDIRPEAEADIRSAARWYETERTGLGVRFTEAIYEAIDLLADNALLYRIKLRRHRHEVRWTFPKGFPFRVMYYVEGLVVRVFAVFHAKRDDQEWKRRV